MFIARNPKFHPSFLNVFTIAISRCETPELPRSTMSIHYPPLCSAGCSREGGFAGVIAVLSGFNVMGAI